MIPSAQLAEIHGDMFEITYAHDRRKQNRRHRCQCCSKPVNAGEMILMYRVAQNITRVLHVDCADRPSFDGLTFRQLGQLHADAYVSKR